MMGPITARGDVVPGPEDFALLHERGIDIRAHRAVRGDLRPGSGLGGMWKEVAVGAGVGLRFDASIIVVRFDLAFRCCFLRLFGYFHDPVPERGNKPS